MTSVEMKAPNISLKDSTSLCSEGLRGPASYGKSHMKEKGKVTLFCSSISVRISQCLNLIWRDFTSFSFLTLFQLL